MASCGDFVGFNDEILELKFINKDTFLICSNSDTIRLMNSQTKESRLIYGHRDIVTTCDLNPSNHLVTGSKDGRILLWGIDQTSEGFPQMQLKKKYKGHISYVASVSIGQKTGNLFVSCGGDGLVKLWNIARQTCKTVKPHKKEINFCRINRNEKYVLSGSQDKHVILYSAKTLKIIKEIKGHARGIWDADFAPFEPMFVTCSSDQLIKIWDLKFILEAQKGQFNHLATNSNAKDLLSKKTQITNKRKQLSEDQENELLVKQVLAENTNNSISQLIQTSQAGITATIGKSECLWTLEGHESPVIRVKWVNIGLQILSGDSEGVVKLWNYRKGSCLFSIHKHQGRIWALDVFEKFKFEEGEETRLIRAQFTEQIKILSGDNDCGLFLWADDTQTAQAEILGDRQKRKVIHDELELKIKDSQFKEAIMMCFDRKMNSWFFKTVQRWQKDFMADWLVESIVFSFDDYCQQLYSNLLGSSKLSLREEEFQIEFQALVEELFEKDPARLLLICQSFITHSKYAWTVQLVLHCLFGKCIQMGNLAELHDLLKPKKVDLKKVLLVYLNFSEKLMRRNSLQREVITRIGFDLKINNLS